MTLPLLLPAIAAGAMLTFALSFDDLIITTFNAGVGSSTLPIYIYSKIRFGVTPEINAISTIIVAVTAILIFARLAAGRACAATSGAAPPGSELGRASPSGSRRRPRCAARRPSCRVPVAPPFVVGFGGGAS